MLELVQGSEEWKAIRRKKITGTDAGVIMGVNPYKSAYTLWQQKLELIDDDKVNEAMKKGSEMEPIARQKYVELTGNPMMPTVEFHKEIDWLMASLDGISIDREKILEIKCGAKAFEQAKEGKIPDYYYAQIQHCLLVSNAKSCDYFVCDGFDHVLMFIDRDEDYIFNLLNREYDFYQCLIRNIPPQIDESDHIYINDEEFTQAAIKWKEANKALKEAKEIEEACRQALIALTDDGNVMGAGIKITRILRDGSIDYKQIIKDFHIDISKYRKPQIGFYKITEVI